MKRHSLQTILLSLLIFSCSEKNTAPDAAGTFEAIETIISAEANGKLLAFNVTEGDIVKQGQVIGFIDSTQLYLTKVQLMQNRKAILSGRPDVKTQIESLKEQLNNAIADRDRIANLVKGEVASQKQLDDANMKITVLQSTIDATKSTLNTTRSTLTEQGNTVDVQLSQIEDQLRKCKIINPINGTVLAKYAEQNEITSTGKPLYKIADLSSILLRAYITGNQLPRVKLNQKIKVLTDNGAGSYTETEGVVTWISDKAEFTPKTIQTKDERANMVYAVKVNVKNDGTYKIGMYGELKFQ